MSHYRPTSLLVCTCGEVEPTSLYPNVTTSCAKCGEDVTSVAIEPFPIGEDVSDLYVNKPDDGCGPAESD